MTTYPSPFPKTLQPFLDRLRSLVKDGMEYPDAEWSACKSLSDADVARVRAAYDAPACPIGWDKV
jgi:hypothetical protein